MADVLISELLGRASRPLLSLEFFPPQEHRAFARLQRSIHTLHEMHPDFVTVTYGAGGSTRARTLALCELLRDMEFSPVMPHLTCVGATREALEGIADDLYDRGFRNIMALRGDPPEGEPAFQKTEGGFAYARDLVALLKRRHPDLCCGVAGYPETHPEAESPEADIGHLKEKVDAGASFVTTQLFFDNRLYFDFVDRCRKAGIEQPIIPGLLPAVSTKQAKRIMSLCHASFPDDLARALEAAGGDTPEAEEVGIKWTVKQIHGLLKHGAPGAHLYILNRAKTALAPALAECLARWRQGKSPRAKA